MNSTWWYRKVRYMKQLVKASVWPAMLLGLMCFCVSCSNTYYKAMEKVGMHKRDILIDRVEAGRDSQADAQEQFQTALERFDSVVKLKETDLKKAYDKLDGEYTKCEKAAAEVTDRIEKIESVADALFAEWKAELKEYENKELRSSSEKQMRVTKERYEAMITTMKTAEESMAPVLRIFHDNVLFLKHNLNAQAVGSLQTEFAHLEGQITELIRSMNAAIASSNSFISEIKH